VNDLFQSSDDAQIRNVHCETSGSEVILRGSVTATSKRQLAQAIAKNACGMREITNEIVVIDSTRC
jgi:osmotically-inducible protein OsmY